MSKIIIHPQVEGFVRALAPEPRRRLVRAMKAVPTGDIKALAAAVLQIMEQPAAGVVYGASARQASQSGPAPANEAAEYAAIFERLRH